MTIGERMFFLFGLLRSRAWQYGLIAFGIFMGVLILVLSFGFSQGIKQAIISPFFSSVDTIIMQSLDIQTAQPRNITLDDYVFVQSLEGVSSVGRVISFMIPSTLSSGYLPFPFDFFFIQGVDPDVIDEFISFSGDDTPVVISPISLDLINSLLHSFVGFSRIDSKDILHHSFRVEFGKSTFVSMLSRSRTFSTDLYLSGFSPLAPLLGVMLPLDDALIIANAVGLEVGNDTYAQLIIKTVDPVSQDRVLRLLQERGFVVSFPADQSQDISSMLGIIQVVFLLSSFIIIILSSLFLSSSISITITEQRKNIGILRSLGESKEGVFILFFIFGVVGVFIVAFLSIILSFSLGIYLDQLLLSLLPSLSFSPNSFFLFTGIDIFIFFLGTTFLSIISVVIPSYRAANIPPLQAILD